MDPPQRFQNLPTPLIALHASAETGADEHARPRPVVDY